MLVSYSTAVEEIKNRCNIVDVISSVVTLQRAGSNMKGLCPFHNEKTGSFMVSESRQMFNCFGCGAKGDVIEFVKKYYNLSFPEAVERLAAQYGIELQQLYDKSEKQKTAYYEANRLAARFFYDSFTKLKNPGFDYMKGREIEPGTLIKFGIGYADTEWTSLCDYLKSCGIETGMLKELGLVSEKDGRIFDKFRSRVIFPIINTRGKVIGFGGRIVGDGEPKYLNSPESLVFQKKNNLFGLNLTRTEIQKEGFAVLVEGYMDVVALYQGGIKNTAASLGTALTENQAKLLKRYTDKVVLCYDADAAGVKAALRGIDILRSAGLEVRVLHVDDGKDPDEYIKKHGREAFLKLIKEKALPDVDYKIALIRKKYNVNETAEAVKFIKAAAGVIKLLSPVEAELYIKKIASESGISESSLRRECEGSESKPFRPSDRLVNKDSSKSGSQVKDAMGDKIERNLLRLCLLKSEYFKAIQEYPESMISDEAMNICHVLNSDYAEGVDFDLEKLRDRLENKELFYLNSIIDEIKIGEKDSVMYKECLGQLKTRRLKKREHEILDSLDMAEQQGDNAADILMKELSTIQRELKKC